jgi:hypothetical protein
MATLFSQLLQFVPADIASEIVEWETALNMSRVVFEFNDRVDQSPLRLWIDEFFDHVSHVNRYVRCLNTFSWETGFCPEEFPIVHPAMILSYTKKRSQDYFIDFISRR